MRKCGTDFFHDKCGINADVLVKVRSNIPKDKLTILDRQVKVKKLQQPFHIVTHALKASSGGRCCNNCCLVTDILCYWTLLRRFFL